MEVITKVSNYLFRKLITLTH